MADAADLTESKHWKNKPKNSINYNLRMVAQERFELSLRIPEVLYLTDVQPQKILKYNQSIIKYNSD